MKGTAPFHRFTNPRRDKSVYVWLWDSYLLYRMCSLLPYDRLNVRDGLEFYYLSNSGCSDFAGTTSFGCYIQRCFLTML